MMIFRVVQIRSESYHEEDLNMKQRKYMLLAMLAAAALIMTACSNKKADVDTAEAQESLMHMLRRKRLAKGWHLYVQTDSGRCFYL